MPVLISYHIDPWLYASAVLFFALQLVFCFACRKAVLRLCPSIVLGGILALVALLGTVLSGEAEWLVLIAVRALPLFASGPLLAWGIFGAVTFFRRKCAARAAE